MFKRIDTAKVPIAIYIIDPNAPFNMTKCNIASVVSLVSKGCQTADSDRDCDVACGTSPLV